MPKQETSASPQPLPHKESEAEKVVELPKAGEAKKAGTGRVFNQTNTAHFIHFNNGEKALVHAKGSVVVEEDSFQELANGLTFVADKPAQ